MKRLIIGMTAALALAFVGTARADDTKATTESKSTTKKSDDGTTMKTEKKTEQKGTGGSDSTYSTEKKTKTDEKTPAPDTQAAPPAK